MLKRIRRVVLALLLAGIVLAPYPVQAQTGLKVTSTNVQADFPLILKFSVSAESNVNITDVRIRYKVARTSFADVTAEGFVQFTPASKVSLSWSWDMRRSGGLRPEQSLLTGGHH